jgi:15-cis-phytoene synthase
MMLDEFHALNPPKRLALTYAKRHLRDVLALLLNHDVRLAQIVGNVKEPLIGQMRLAWWRDVMSKPAGERPTGEPMLAELASLEEQGADARLACAMLKLVDAWGELLADDEWSPEAIQRHTQAKAAAIFATFAALTGADPAGADQVLTIGERWALAELLQYCQTAKQHDAVVTRLDAGEPVYRLPPTLRPLTILAFAAQQRRQNAAQGLRLIFNALTGR